VNDRVFYLDAVSGSFLGRLARRARTDLYRAFARELAPGPDTTILDVGVSVVEDDPEVSNVLERLHPWPERITMLGIHEGSFLEQAYPGTRYVRYQAGSAFPFPDQSFDVCYCNAVLEHVGDPAQRRHFLRELLRVGRRVYLTTPNRWYPIDFHKMIPFLHWLPQPWYRRLLGLAGDGFYSRRENLDLLSRGELTRLFRELGVPCRILAYRFLGPVSNWLVVAGPRPVEARRVD
jgi:SAM-dependent methyltransferase